MVNEFPPLIRVKAVKAGEGFHVHVVFENGETRVIDLAPYLRGPVFEPMLKDPEVFRSVKTDGTTIVWDNGADIDPDVLYYGLRPEWMEGVESR
jgi:hypothetical protein